MSKGLTLLEVLISLLITGVIVSVALNQTIVHYKLANNVQTDTEMNYSVLRAGQVLDLAVKTAETVKWNGSSLSVSYKLEGKQFSDTWYLADKDFDGQSDLYREHLSVPNPVVTGLTAFNCTEISRGFWKVSLQAGSRKKAIIWERKIRQKCPGKQ